MIGSKLAKNKFNRRRDATISINFVLQNDSQINNSFQLTNHRIPEEPPSDQLRALISSLAGFAQNQSTKGPHYENAFRTASPVA